jgi:hypothetical protein
VLTAGLERALADVLGGFDGGWSFWRAALAELGEAIARSSDGRERFTSYPQGEFRRLLRDVDDALRMAATAVELQALLNGEPDDKGAERRRDIAELLHARARAIAAERNVT